MGMFGAKTGNILQILGATLKDASPDSAGGNLAAIQKMQAERAQAQEKADYRKRLAAMLVQQNAATGSRGPIGPGEDGEPMGGGQPRAASGLPTLQQAFPLLAEGLLAGEEGVAGIGQLLKSAQPSEDEWTPINTAEGIFDYNKRTGVLRPKQTFQPKPEPVTVDRVIGGILAKEAAGQPLTPQERTIYRRWTNGTPAKGDGGGGGAMTGLPPGFKLDP